MPRLGFRMDEVMVGTHTFRGPRAQEGVLPLQFTLSWGADSLLRFLNPQGGGFLLSEARGVMTVGGLVDKADCTGSLHMLYFSERKIRYTLAFSDDQGRPYRYVGEKRNIWPWNLHRTHVTCYGTIIEVDSGELVSESTVYFPYRELIPFMLSARLRLKGAFDYP